MAQSVWPAVHAERAALADDLSDLTAAAWATPSLCEDWNVHQLLGHLVATARMTPPRFVGKIVSSGFSFDRMADKDARSETAGGPAATLGAFRSLQTATTSPPGPKGAWLGEALLHAEDIRRPLGLRRDYPTDAVTATLDFYKGSNLIVGTKKRIAGVTLKATDADWSTGDGPLAEGPAMSLLMVATGRKSALDDLTGPGVEILRNR